MSHFQCKVVLILLQDLKDMYGLEWTTSLIGIDADEQEKPWLLALNPNDKMDPSIHNFEV